MYERRRLIVSLFKRKKWELVEEGKEMISVNPLLDMRRTVICDVYRKAGKDGIYKYKYVPRY